MARTALLLAVIIGLAASCRTVHRDSLQHYPNLAGDVVFENDRLVVQRFVIQPGQWEGIHAHPGHQLYVHIRGGTWTVRYGDKEEVSIEKDGSVGWQDAVDLSARHESGNTGDAPIEWLWITLKR